MTVHDLLAELATLDLDAKSARFTDIVAELINHAAEIEAELAALATSLHHQQRAALAAVIGRRQRPEDAPALVRLLGDAHPRVRRSAARAAVAFPRPEAAGRLLELALGDDTDVVLAAVDALGKLGEPRALAVAATLLAHDAWTVRQAAAVALARLGDPEALGPLLGARLDGQAAVRNAIQTALDRLVAPLAPADVERRLAALGEPTWRKILAGLGDDKKLLPTVRAALERLAAATADRGALESFGRIVDGADAAPAHERDALLDTLAGVFLREGPKAVVLVGEPGSGKTHLVRALARRLGGGPEPWLVLETSTSEIMVGTKYIGEWETRLGDLIAKARAPRRVLLYFSNINNLPGAGTTSSNKANFLSMLGPYLRRGELAVIGESAPAELQRGLEAAGAKGLFQLITVPEPEPAAARRILGRALAEMARGLGVELVLPAEVEQIVVDLAATYHAGLAEPGRSLRLLGDVVRHRLDRGTREPRIELGADDVVAGLARATGLPEQLLSDKKPLDPAEVRAFFDERVLGQREAVDAIVDLITLVKAGLTDPGKPLGVLFFVGPTGVGKTEIAKTLAEYIFGSPDRMIRVDLAEYKEYSSFERLIGSRWGEGGVLTGKVREQPFSVILLDEFEKAHANIFDLFLQVFDDGRLTDGKGVTADFRRAIVVMTSNLGSSAAGSGGLGFGAGAGAELPSEDKVLREIRRFFRPEFINRIGKIVVFKPLAGDVMRMIVRRELGKVLLRSGILRRRLLVDVDPGVVDKLLAEGFSVEYGARPLKRRVEELVLLPLARAIVALGPGDHGTLLRVSVDDDRIAVRRTRPPRPPEAERLQLKRLEDERTASVKPADLPAILAALEARAGHLAALAETQRFEERKSAIVAATSAPSFWDEPTRARRALADLAYIEGLLEGLSRARRRLDGLADFARSYSRHGAELKGRFERAHDEVRRELVELEYRFLGEKPEDRADVFLGVKRIGQERDAAEAAELVRRMYVSWAERRGFQLTPVRSRDDEAGPAEAVWLVEGPSPFGLLRGEEGLHRFEGGGKGPERRALFVRVELAARPDDDDARLARKDVRLERSAGEVVAVHAPTGTSVEASGELPDALVLELLEAEVAARARRRGVDPDRIVRRYGIEGRFARDEDTGIRAGHKELAAGGLDEILRARRLGPTPPLH